MIKLPTSSYLNLLINELENVVENFSKEEIPCNEIALLIHLALTLNLFIVNRVIIESNERNFAEK